jgi:ubiquinone/menaquinone biosynthesis C-methylase UbiE
MSLLDVGCGPGTITAGLATRVSPGRVVGLETSESILELARAEVGNAPIEFRVGDAMALPFEDGAFDVVHAHQVLQHLQDPVGALREMARVCRPGGIVAAKDGDFPAMAWYPESPGLDEWLDRYCQVARANGTDPAAGRKLLAWAHAAGLTNVTPSASVWCYATDEERSWWGDLWASRITESEVARRALELGIASAEDLARIATAWRTWGADPDGWFVIVNGEILARPLGRE